MFSAWGTLSNYDTSPAPIDPRTFRVWPLEPMGDFSFIPLAGLCRMAAWMVKIEKGRESSWLAALVRSEGIEGLCDPFCLL